MKTIKAKIDVDKGVLSCEFDGEQISFNIFEAMKNPNDSESMNFTDMIDPLVQEYFETEVLQEKGELVLTSNLGDWDIPNSSIETPTEEIAMICYSEEVSQMFSPIRIPILNPSERMMPSLTKAPKLELKPLPNNL